MAETAEHVRAFDWSDVARQTAAVYDELVRARPERVADVTTKLPTHPGGHLATKMPTNMR